MITFKSNLTLRVFFTLLVCFCYGFLWADHLWAESAYVVDPDRSFVKASVHYAVFLKFRAKFTDVAGKIIFDPQRKEGNSVDIRIKTKSLTTGNAGWDRTIHSGRLMDVQKYPVMTFQSRSIKKIDSGYKIEATVNLHGISRNVEFPFDVVKQGRVANMEYIVAKGVWIINRKDYQITWHSAFDKTGVVVGNAVTVDWEIYATRPAT